MSATTKDAGAEHNINNGLLLYHHPYSYYSHKVVMALHEKRLPFKSHIVDLINGCHFEPWFIKLNPRAEIPVLQDTGKIIPDSTRIIDYLEDNFSNGAPRLIPVDQGPEVKQKVIYYRNKLDQIQSSPLTYGSLEHSELVRSPRLPFIGPVRRLLLVGVKTIVPVLRKHADLNIEAREVLNQKAVVLEKAGRSISDKDEYLKVLDQVNDVLTEVENQLSMNLPDHPDWWLCSDRFTVADISLIVLLERLSQLGYEYRFWRNGLRPNIEKYYLRAQQRSSYHKTIPSTVVHIKMFIVSFKKPIIISFVGVAVVTFALGSGYYLLKHLKK